MNPVTAIPAADPVRAVAHVTDRLRLETDCADVHAALWTREPGFVLLDVRGPEAHARGHVPGAVNLPHRTISDETLKRWPPGTLFVVHCAGPHCNGADKAAARLAAHGKRAKLMLGGVAGWQDAGFDLAKGRGSTLALDGACPAADRSVLDGRNSPMSRRTWLGLALALALGAGPATAADLRFGIANAPSSMDPHFHNLLVNNMTLQHVFEPLTWEEVDGRITPRLAEGWRIVDDTTWEFRLRRDVRFHDGSPLTADDVIFTLGRVPTVPNSPGLFVTFVRPIVGIDRVDDHTLRFRTASPYPFLPRDLTAIMILSERIHRDATTADFNSGRVMVGTGPYRFLRYVPNESVELAVNPTYRDGAEPWQTVSIRAITQDGARGAALLAGDIDIMDRVPGSDLARFRADPRLRLASIPAASLVYMFPDGNRPDVPFLTDHAGRPLPANPLADVRVRRALAMSIDRAAFADRLLEGQAAPAHQLLGPIAEGHNPSLPPIPYDPERARRLLAEAGYPDGFTLTIHGPTGFIPDDGKMLQAVGQYFTRIGVRTRVETQPRNVFFPKATAREFAMFLGSWVGTLGANTLRALLTTYSPERGWGAFNRQRYSNPTLDSLMDRALATLDDETRNRLIAEAERVAMEDMALIPLVSTRSTWAMRADKVAYTPSPLSRSQAMLARPVR